MICSDIIDKDSFYSFLNKSFINKEDIVNLSYLFYYLKDISVHEKIMFLLYNEYVSIDNINSVITSDSTMITAINAIITNSGIDFTDTNNLYKHIRKRFLRDYITELSLANYKDDGNIMDQLDVVFKTLTKDETDFLRLLGIDRTNFNYLVRIPDESSNANNFPVRKRAVIESNYSVPIQFNGGFTDILNGRYDTETIKYSDLLISILNKISLGTIH